MKDKYQIYVEAKNYGKKKGAAYGLILYGWGTGKGKRRYIWERSFEADKVTTNQAALHAINFALRCIKKDLRRKAKVEVIINNKYIKDNLAKKDDGWAKKPSSNQELIVVIRDLVDTFTEVNVLLENNSQFRDRVKKLSETVANKGMSINRITHN
jgi:ribonuclease HI